MHAVGYTVLLNLKFIVLINTTQELLHTILLSIFVIFSMPMTLDPISCSLVLQEYLLFGFAALLLSVYVSVEYYSVRRLVLDPDTHHYSVYKGAMLIATEHCHNIYIRLLTKSSGIQEIIL